MTLERQVDPPRPRTGIRRAALILLGVSAVGIAAMAHAMRPLLPDEDKELPPTPAAAPHITVTTPPPIVIHLETVVQSPVAPAPAASSIGCPVLPADEPIGKPIKPAGVAPAGRVEAAANAPVLAVLVGAHVWVSEDDGRSWSRAFGDHGVDRIVVAPDGTIYAQEYLELGVRLRGGKTVWRTLETGCAESDRCVTSIGTLGSELVAFIDDRILTSSDRGKTWKKVTGTDGWSARTDGDVFAFRGALYQVNHYTDMCGVDDWHTYRFDAKHRVTFDVFHNYFTDNDEPVLVPSNDFDTVWTWDNRCRVVDDAAGRCKKNDPARRALMETAMLSPLEGGRTFAVYGKSLIELCESGVRQVYREFPFEHLGAVDASGRALVMDGEDLVRWSPSSGWRKLRTFVNQQARDEQNED